MSPMFDSLQLLSEAQSAEIAGVSVETLKQYREFGLLESVEANGQIFFKESDIRTLFYTKSRKERTQSQILANSQNNAPEATQAPAAVQQPAVAAAPVLTAEIRSDVVASDSAVEKHPTLDGVLGETSLPGAEASPSAIPIERTSSVGAVTPVTMVEGPQPDAAKIETTADTFSENKAFWFGEGPDADVGPPLLYGPAPLYVPPVSEAKESEEVSKLLREQIETLRRERDWLRERVEKLENRSEREQMLLLSESETIRNLVSMNQEQRRKPFWRLALPWFDVKSQDIK